MASTIVAAPAVAVGVAVAMGGPAAAGSPAAGWGADVAGVPRSAPIGSTHQVEPVEAPPGPAPEDGAGGGSPLSRVALPAALGVLVATWVWTRRERRRERDDERAAGGAGTVDADDDSGPTADDDGSWTARRPGGSGPTDIDWDPDYDDYVRGAELLHVALRAAAAGSGRRGLPRLLWAESSEGTVRLVPAAPAAPPPGFRSDEEGGWCPAAGVSRLRSLGTGVAAPLPQLVPLGEVDEETDLLVDLAPGRVAVDGPEPQAAAVVRAIALAAAAAPWREQAEVVLVGLAGTLAELPWVTATGTWAEAVGVAAGLRESGEMPVALVGPAPPGDPDRRMVRRLGMLIDDGVVVVSRPVGRHAGLAAGRTMSVGEDGILKVDGLRRPVRARLVDDVDSGGLLVTM